MKKKTMALVACASALCFALVGCSGGSGGNGGASEADAAAFQGDWTARAITLEGTPMSEYEIQLMRDMQLECTAQVTADKVTLNLFGEATEGSYTVDDASTITVTFEDGAMTGTLAEGELTLADDTDSIVFVKADTAAASAANEPADEPADEPAADEPAADEPAADEPAADEPAADETAADEPQAETTA